MIGEPGTEEPVLSLDLHHLRSEHLDREMELIQEIEQYYKVLEQNENSSI